MPELTAVLAAEQYRAALLASERQAAVRLVNSYGTIYRRLTSQIDALTADIDAIIAREGSVSVARVGRLDRMRALRGQVLDEMNRYAVLVEDAVDQGAREAIAAGLESARGVTQAALPGVAQADAVIMSSWNRLNPEAVESMLGFLADDSALKMGLREAFGPSIAEGVRKGLLEGIGLGYNPRKVAAIFQREMGMGLVSALRTARTTQLMAYRETSRAAYVANPDIVKGWKWKATRDERTCGSCLAMDGTLHKPDESLQDHWNGRCVALPVTVTYKDLGLNVAEPPDPDTWLKSLTEDDQRRMLGRRYEAWKSGETRFSENARDWFTRQPESVQRNMLGPGKYEAWKSGAFGLDELSVRVTDPIWGNMRVEAPLKLLVKEEEKAA